MSEACYLYAFVDGSLRVDGRRGLEGAPLRILRVGGIGAVVSSLTDEGVSPSVDNVLGHEMLVESLMADSPVLPARFGSVFLDEEAIRTALVQRSPVLVAALAQVRGRVEMGVRAIWREHGEVAETDAEKEEEAGFSQGPGDPGPGTLYLRRRMQQLHQHVAARELASQVARDIDALLSRHAVASHLEVMRTPRLVLSGSYLVDRDGIGGFRAVVARVKADHPELVFLLSGPWPPYHFCG